MFEAPAFLQPPNLTPQLLTPAQQFCIQNGLPMPSGTYLDTGWVPPEPPTTWTDTGGRQPALPPTEWTSDIGGNQPKSPIMEFGEDGSLSPYKPSQLSGGDYPVRVPLTPGIHHDLVYGAIQVNRDGTAVQLPNQYPAGQQPDIEAIRAFNQTLQRFRGDLVQVATVNRQYYADPYSGKREAEMLAFMGIDVKQFTGQDADKLIARYVKGSNIEDFVDDILAAIPDVWVRVPQVEAGLTIARTWGSLLFGKAKVPAILNRLEEKIKQEREYYESLEIGSLRCKKEPSLTERRKRYLSAMLPDYRYNDRTFYHSYELHGRFMKESKLDHKYFVDVALRAMGNFPDSAQIEVGLAIARELSTRFGKRNSALIMRELQERVIELQFENSWWKHGWSNYVRKNTEYFKNSTKGKREAEFLARMGIDVFNFSPEEVQRIADDNIDIFVDRAIAAIGSIPEFQAELAVVREWAVIFGVDPEGVIANRVEGLILRERGYKLFASERDSDLYSRYKHNEEACWREWNLFIENEDPIRRSNIRGDLMLPGKWPPEFGLADLLKMTKESWQNWKEELVAMVAASRQFYDDNLLEGPKIASAGKRRARYLMRFGIDPRHFTQENATDWFIHFMLRSDSDKIIRRAVNAMGVFPDKADVYVGLEIARRLVSILPSNQIDPIMGKLQAQLDEYLMKEQKRKENKIKKVAKDGLYYTDNPEGKQKAEFLARMGIDVFNFTGLTVQRIADENIAVFIDKAVVAMEDITADTQITIRIACVRVWAEIFGKSKVESIVRRIEERVRQKK